MRLVTRAPVGTTAPVVAEAARQAAATLGAAEPRPNDLNWASRIESGAFTIIATVVSPMVSDPAEVAAGTVDHEHPRPWSRLMRLLGQEKRLISFVYLYAGLAGLFSLALPLGVQAIIGLVAGGMIFQPVVLLIAFVIVGTLSNGGLQIMQLSVVETKLRKYRAEQAELAKTAMGPES